VARIAIFGAGYVGLVTGACFADLGHEVVVRDVLPERIEALQAGEVPIYEPGLDEVLERCRDRISFTLDVREAVAGADFLYVAVGTPPTYAGDADLSAVWTVVDELPDDALIMPCGYIGAPVVSIEKLGAGEEGGWLRDGLEQVRAGHALASLAQRYLDHAAIEFNQLTGSGKSKLTFDCVAVEKAAEYAAENADGTLRLWQLLKPRLTSERVVSVYETLERPLVSVLARMERRGISIDREVLSRLSGDQFAMILLSEREPARIVGFAETIRRALRAPIAFNDREIFLTASIGMALAENPTQRTDEVLKDAELAMYYAKRIGGDRIEIFKPAMRSRKTDRLAMESELRRAIEREEIKVLYQPIVRLEDRAIAGFEALARWDHPKLGRLSPAEFISIAEEIGLIVDLGLFVLEHTARQLAQWQAATRSREPVFASVNVSSRQLLRHDLIQDLRGVLGRTSLARGTLKLEITESLVMENPEHAAQMLTRIKELGAGLSLDDFGTGHSSLAYLQRFPFDTIKIDQSFVRTTPRGTRPVILRSIIALAHDLGMEVVAEGAETDSDAVELYQLGCEYAQGFAFGEPMSAEGARDLLIDKPTRLRALKIASE